MADIADSKLNGEVESKLEKEDGLKVNVKWNGSFYPIQVFDNMTVADFRSAVQSLTNVRPTNQKLVNLKYKGKPASDDQMMSALGLKQNSKIMMIGSIDEVLAEAAYIPDDLPPVINDLDIEEEQLGLVHTRSDFIAKVDKRAKEYDIKVINPTRPGKKLLVLDIDYTLFDHRSVGQNGQELMRPYLHEFLISAYQDYDIAIWSATSMKWIEEKMKLLGVATNPNYKIVFYIDSTAMIRVKAPGYGVVDVKPLGVIWANYPCYTHKNTIMFDDLRRNFLMNPQNGLKIRPFKNAHANRDRDRELLKLADYLQEIALLEDISKLKHSRWESYHRR